MIEVNNTTRSTIDEVLLKKTAEMVLGGEKVKNSELSVAIVGPKKMQELNKKYRRKDKAANVLSFPNGKESIPNEVEGYLGEVVLCPQEVRKDAKKYGILFKEALAWMLIHGILHLLDYNHEDSVKKAQQMEEKEEFYLRLIRNVTV